MGRPWDGVAAALGIAGLVLASGMAEAAEIHVMASGAFTGAFRTIAPRFEQATGHKLALAWGPSFGTTRDALPVRIASGEPVDVLLIVDGSLEGLVASGGFKPASRAPVAVSPIGLGVREGAPKPDVRTLDAVRRALLAAASIGYSEGASGVFVSKDLVGRLGIADQVAPKMRKITGELVGDAIARGEVEVGIQQVSELLSVKGVAFAGPLPGALQNASTMTAAVAAGSKEAGAAGEFVAFLATAASRQELAASGLEPAGAAKAGP